MATCPSCGGIIGRDCFNPVECAQITASMNQQNSVDLGLLELKFNKLIETLKVKGIDLSELDALTSPPNSVVVFDDSDGLPF